MRSCDANFRRFSKPPPGRTFSRIKSEDDFVGHSVFSVRRNFPSRFAIHFVFNAVVVVSRLGSLGRCTHCRENRPCPRRSWARSVVQVHPGPPFKSPIITRRFSLLSFTEPPPKKRFAKNLPKVPVVCHCLPSGLVSAALVASGQFGPPVPIDSRVSPIAKSCLRSHAWGLL